MTDGPGSNGGHEKLALSQRLRLLIDLHAIEHGADPTYSEVAAYLAERGVSMSRARWSYMSNGHRDISDAILLTGIAEFFGVHPDFLLNDGPLPDRVEAQLNLIRAMRESRVRAFAARTLGDVSPRTLKMITQFLDDAAAMRQQGE